MDVKNFEQFLEMGFKFVQYSEDGFEFPHNNDDVVGGFEYCTESQLEHIHNNLAFMLCPSQKDLNELHIT
jgi:hypothetical protein